MDAKMVANYLTLLKSKTDITYEEISAQSGLSLSTVKNLFSGKSEDPRLATVAPVTKVLDGSLDEMYFGKRKEAVFPNQANVITEQHFKDVVMHYENRLLDKDRIIYEKDNHNKTIQKSDIISKIFAGVCVAILVGLLILEVSNPNLGWIQF